MKENPRTKDNQQKNTKQNSIDLLSAKAEKIINKNRFFLIPIV